MQVRHKSSPEDGLQHIVITDLPRKTRNSRTEGSNLSSDLVEGLRCRAGREGILSIDAGGTL